MTEKPLQVLQVFHILEAAGINSLALSTYMESGIGLKRPGTEVCQMKLKSKSKVQIFNRE